MMWDAVAAELDAWNREGRVAVFWWRDDDAVDVSAKLDALLNLARRHGVPVGLSVIPSLYSKTLCRRLECETRVDVLVHGHAHVNHALPGQKMREYCIQRRTSDMERELVRSLAMIRDGFGDRALPVLVPPWNRIPQRLTERLAGLGYKGLSGWKPRGAAPPPAGLCVVNTHIDPIDWRGGRIPKAERAVAGTLLRALRWRRSHPDRSLEPMGLLTHHLHWGPELAHITDTLVGLTGAHPAARWIPARRAFGL